MRTALNLHISCIGKIIHRRRFLYCFFFTLITGNGLSYIDLDILRKCEKYALQVLYSSNIDQSILHILSL